MGVLIKTQIYHSGEQQVIGRCYRHQLGKIQMNFYGLLNFLDLFFFKHANEFYHP